MTFRLTVKQEEALRVSSGAATHSKAHWYVTFPGASELWFAGLDDKERTEKVLGKEYATVLLNECSQIPWASRQMVMTRLAQKSMQVIGGEPKPLKLRALYDCNPPSKAHRTYRVFHQELDPETREPLPPNTRPVDWCGQFRPRRAEHADGYPTGTVTPIKLT